MEDLQPQDVEALAAHLQGLEAALEALGKPAAPKRLGEAVSRHVAEAA